MIFFQKTISEIVFFLKFVLDDIELIKSNSSIWLHFYLNDLYISTIDRIEFGFSVCYTYSHAL